MIQIEKAIETDLNEILNLQRLAYQSEAILLNNFSIPPLMQTLEEVQQEFARNPTNRELLQEFMKLKQMNTLLASQANNIFN